MTLKELSRLYYLNREIEMDKKRLEELETDAHSIKSTRYSDLPKAPSINSATEENIAKIIDLEKIINNKLSRCIHERTRLEEYISNIPDSLTRQIFTLRFINGLPWFQVAAHIGGNTEDSVKKIAYRYIKKHCDRENTPS